MNKPIYDSKVVILDINFLTLNEYNLDDNLYAKKLIKELTANQNLIFITDNTFTIAEKIVNNLEIKSGFLITDSGGSITNIANKKKIEETLMFKEDAIKIANKCIWNNLSFSIHTLDTTYPFRIMEDWIIRRYKSDLSYLYNYSGQELHTINEVKECIENNFIRSIEIYFLDNDDESRRKQMIKKIIKSLDSENINYSVESSILHVIPSKFSKFTAIKNLASAMNWNLKEDGLYVGVNQFISEMNDESYLTISSFEAFEKKDHTTFPNYKFSGIIAPGATSWISWMYHNQHLWKGLGNDIIKDSLSKVKKYSLDPEDIENFKSGKSKYLTISTLPHSKNVKKTWISSIYKKKSNMFKNHKYLIKLCFWSNQIPTVLKFFDNKTFYN